MTPDEHYARAKELLDIADETYESLAEKADSGTNMTDGWWARSYADLSTMTQLAHAHATMALYRPEEQR